MFVNIEMVYSLQKSIFTTKVFYLQEKRIKQEEGKEIKQDDRQRTKYYKTCKFSPSFFRNDVTHGQTTLNNKKLVPSISLISLTKKCFPNKLHRNTVRT